MFLLPCCAPVFFGGVFVYVFAICWGFCSRKCLAKILFFLGLVPETPFRERIFVLLSCCALVVRFLGTFPGFCPLVPPPSPPPSFLSPPSSSSSSGGRPRFSFSFFLSALQGGRRRRTAAPRLSGLFSLSFLLCLLGSAPGSSSLPPSLPPSCLSCFFFFSLSLSFLHIAIKYHERKVETAGREVD